MATSEFDFVGQYMDYMKSSMAEKGMSETEITAELASTKEMMEKYQTNRPFRMGLTFLEIFPVGILVSLISALIFGVFLKHKGSVSP